MSSRPATLNAIGLSRDLSDVRMRLERLQALLGVHDRQFADLDRTPPPSVGEVAARRLRALLRRE